MTEPNDDNWPANWLPKPLLSRSSFSGRAHYCGSRPSTTAPALDMAVAKPVGTPIPAVSAHTLGERAALNLGVAERRQ